MNLLLDTHVALWAITDDPKLSTKAREMITSSGTNVWISVASLWEIAIKHSLGRQNMPISSLEAKNYFIESGYQLLNVEAEHVIAVEHLASHHQDPFDRLLIAQSIIEPMRLITHDAAVAEYGESIIKI